MIFQSIIVTAAALSIWCIDPANAQFEETEFIDPFACKGQGSCQNNVLEDALGFGYYLNITGASCNADNSCSFSTKMSSFTVENACTAEGTCSNNQQDTSVSDSSCTGAGSCSNNVQGMLVSADSCGGAQSCSDNSVRLITFGSVCTGEGSCSKNVGDGDVIDTGLFTDFSP